MKCRTDFNSLILVIGESRLMNQRPTESGQPDPGKKPASRAAVTLLWSSFKGIWTQRNPGARFERKRLMRVDHRFLAQERP